MKVRTFRGLVGAVVLVGAAVPFLACSGGDSAVSPIEVDAAAFAIDAAFDVLPPDPGREAGGGAVVDAALDAKDDRIDAADAADAADARPLDCSANPKLRNVSAGFRCAFAPVGASTCASTETCCNPVDKNGGGSFYPSFCAAGKSGDATCAARAPGEGSLYTAGAAWECADKSACGPSSVCCLIQDPVRLMQSPANTLNIGSTPANDPVHPAACGAQRAYNAGGTRCRPSCGVGEIKLCSLSEPSCGAGTVCTPFEASFRDLGYCK